MEILETDRLLLRAFRESDLDGYAEMLGDPEVSRWLNPNGQPMSRADAWRHMALVVGHWQLRGYGMWAVEERTTGAMIGRVGCWFPEGWPEPEVGWALRREYWRHGYATEAAQASVRYAFTELNWPRVISVIRPDNAASIRVAERIGERLEGRTQLMGFDTLIYAMSRDEWGASQQHA